YRDEICYRTCMAEKAYCFEVPDIPTLAQDLVRAHCAFPFRVVLQSINSVCSFSPLDPVAEVKVSQAGNALVRFGFLTLSDFDNVTITFCDNIPGSGVVPDRDTVFLHSSLKDVEPKALTAYLAHE